jgi:hypothetical protein
MKVIKPPFPLVKTGINVTSIFLAGSIEMGSSEDWQTVIEDRLKSVSDDFVIINPRRDSWDSSWTQSFSNPQFYQQVNWELNGLEKADIIVMYFSPETKSPISLLELGLYADSGKMIVCCPNGFWRKGNVEIVCEKYGIPLFDNFEDLLKTLDHIIV